MAQNGTCTSAMDEDHSLDGSTNAGGRHEWTPRIGGERRGTDEAAGPPRAFSERDVSILRLIAQYMQDLGLR